ncbi:MAG: hypothetical protein AAFO91_18475 [Bacteroidota bacterium]
MGRLIRRIYTLFQWLSLDVVLGALFSGMMVAQILEIEMPIYWYWVLPLSVWVIYTTDHLMDARRLKDAAHTPRHLFHYRYFRLLGTLWAIGLGTCLLYVPFLIDEQMFRFGIGMGILVLGHLALVWLIGDRIAWFLHKELGVALIYSAGVWGAPMVLCAHPIPVWCWILAGQFFMLAILNLLLFSLYEWESDTLDQHTSFVRGIGRKAAKRLCWSISALIIGLGIWIAILDPTINWPLLQLVYTLMLTGLLWLLMDEDRFRFAERYRLLGDGVFLLPIIALLG